MYESFSLDIKEKYLNQINKSNALTGTTVSAVTTAYINNKIASQTEQSIKEKTPRGRPKKINTLVPTEASSEAAFVEHQSPLIERHYNLRRRNNIN